MDGSAEKVVFGSTFCADASRPYAVFILFEVRKASKIHARKRA